MNAQLHRSVLFAIGDVVATRGALELLDRAKVSGLEQIVRHVTGDFGEDVEANRAAIRDGGRILSSYLVAGKKLWLITEADRSVTTLLLPEEY